jgi:DNA/RNA non-specific endonuclease
MTPHLGSTPAYIFHGNRIFSNIGKVLIREGSMALNVYTSLSNNPPREDGEFFDASRDGTGGGNDGAAAGMTDASTPPSPIAVPPPTDQALLPDPMLTYGAAEFVARGGVIAYGLDSTNTAAQWDSAGATLLADSRPVPHGRRADAPLAKNGEDYGGGGSYDGGSDDEDGFGGSDAGGGGSGSAGGSDWGGGSDYGTPSWATPSSPAGEQPSTSDNDGDPSGNGTNTNAGATGGSDPSGGNGDSGDVGDANNASGGPPAAGTPNASANPLDNCDPTATGTTQQDANGTYHRTNTVNVRVSPYFGTVNPDGTPYTGMITVSDRSASFNASSSSTIGGLRPVSTNTGGAPNEYQAAMDAATRLLGKPQGSITREDVLGVILQLRNVGANPASNLTMRDRQGLSSMFMAVYSRGNGEGVIDASYVPREMVAAGLGAMAFGGSNPRIPRPNSPTGPMLPGTNSAMHGIRVPGPGENLTPYPNGVRFINDYRYLFDGLGRVTTARANSLTLQDGTRNRTMQSNAGGVDRKPRDDGGHIVGHRFNPPDAAYNYFAQNQHINRGPYNQLEASWARLIEQGHQVRVEWRFTYPGNSQRPSGMVVDYWVDGGQRVRSVFGNP